jgi:hypothetical protein
MNNKALIKFVRPGGMMVSTLVVRIALLPCRQRNLPDKFVGKMDGVV